MQLQHKFELPLPARETWTLLNRIEEITPCLPGATAVEVSEDRYDIDLKIRFGPLDLRFKGVVEIAERDVAGHKLVVKTKANDAKGQGSASGTTVATMTEEAGVTRVVLDTELMIGGRIAQMGRGMVADVSNELLARFVANLKTRFLAESEASGATANVAPNPPAGSGNSQEGGHAHAAPTARPVNTPTAQPAARAEEYADVGGAVRRAMWRRFLNLIFFWRKAD